MSKDSHASDRETALRELIAYFKEHKKVSYDEFVRYLDSAYEKKAAPRSSEPTELAIPMSLFDNKSLSALEAIVKYLHENKGLRLVDVARLLNRDQRAIGVTYRFARKKLSVALKTPASRYALPVGVLVERKLSVLESIVYHLKANYALSYHDIAVLLRRDDRTVWTVYSRALLKFKEH